MKHLQLKVILNKGDDFCHKRFRAFEVVTHRVLSLKIRRNQRSGLMSSLISTPAMCVLQLCPPEAVNYLNI